jgi:hypothetical protein
MNPDNLHGVCYSECCSAADLSGNGTTTRSTTMCNNANTRRRMSRWDQSEANHSNGSLLSSMDRFVQTVDDMNETILVPCRLMDMKFDQSMVSEKEMDKESVIGKRLMANLNGVDLFQFYTMLNSVKNDLKWGSLAQSVPKVQNSSTVPSAPSVISSSNSSSSQSLSQVPQTQNSEVKGHARRPSTVSTTSSASASDTEFSELNEDSGVEAEEEYSTTMAETFHHHLNGLQQSLRDLTIAADYVTTRYNNDLGGLIL